MKPIVYNYITHANNCNAHAMFTMLPTPLAEHILPTVTCTKIFGVGGGNLRTGARAWESLACENKEECVIDGEDVHGHI